MKGYGPGRMLITGLMLVMLTSGAGGESNVDFQPAKKSVLGRNLSARKEVEAMVEVKNHPYDEALIKALSMVKEPGEKAGSAMKTIKVEDFRGQHSYTLSLDLSGQVLRLDIPEDLEFGDERSSRAAPLHRSFSELKGPQGFVSAAALAYKAKQFDDGLRKVLANRP